MTKLNKIYSMILDIQRTRHGRSKKEKIMLLINYIEQINEDIKEMRENLNYPYLNENKISHTLLEIQIQARLMQIGESKSFQKMNVYLFKIRVLIENTIDHLKAHKSVILAQE